MGKRTLKATGWKKWVVGAAVTAAAGAGAFGVSQLPYFVGEKVVEVVDGDTFFIANRQPIRVLGIDAPELSRCGSTEAKAALARMILGKKVVLRQPVSLGSRINALVYQNGVLINAEMLKRGLATYRWDGGSEKEIMKKASDFARDNSVGIFSSECTEPDPPNPKCPIKGNLDENQDWAKIYILPSCDHYSQVKVQKFQGDTWFCTEAEAKKAGYARSSGCNTR